jgi:hypothetical protein
MTFNQQFLDDKNQKYKFAFYKGIHNTHENGTLKQVSTMKFEFSKLREGANWIHPVFQRESR